MNRRTTYTITWPGKKKPVGLALNCHMKGGCLRYYDTVRGHEIEGKITEDGDDAFVFESAGFMPGPWKFQALTIEDFRRYMGRRVENGHIIAQAIKTTADLQEWYRKQYGEEAGLLYPDVLDN
jgi:hypothetical protein